MTTVTDQPPEGAVTRDYRQAALRFYALGRSADDLRLEASETWLLKGMAAMYGTTLEEERAVRLAIAGEIDAAEAEGTTRLGAYFLGGLTEIIGPLTSPHAVLFTAAAYMAAGWTSETLPEDELPQVAAAIALLEERGITRETARQIAATAEVPAALLAPSPRTAPDVLSAA